MPKRKLRLPGSRRASTPPLPKQRPGQVLAVLAAKVERLESLCVALDQDRRRLVEGMKEITTQLEMRVVSQELALHELLRLAKTGDEPAWYPGEDGPLLDMQKYELRAIDLMKAQAAAQAAAALPTPATDETVDYQGASA